MCFAGFGHSVGAQFIAPLIPKTQRDAKNRVSTKEHNYLNFAETERRVAAEMLSMLHASSHLTMSVCLLLAHLSSLMCPPDTPCEI